jgi:hypothetical protein
VRENNREISNLLKSRVPHPFRVLQRNGWDTNDSRVYTISETASGREFSGAGKAGRTAWASQLADKLDLAQTLRRFVTGHEFTRAARTAKIAGL